MTHTNNVFELTTIEPVTRKDGKDLGYEKNYCKYFFVKV
jgi:hypothetical protein